MFIVELNQRFLSNHVNHFNSYIPSIITGLVAIVGFIIQFIIIYLQNKNNKVNRLKKNISKEYFLFHYWLKQLHILFEKIISEDTAKLIDKTLLNVYQNSKIYKNQLEEIYKEIIIFLKTTELVSNRKKLSDALLKFQIHLDCYNIVNNKIIDISGYDKYYFCDLNDLLLIISSSIIKYL